MYEEEVQQGRASKRRRSIKKFQKEVEMEKRLRRSSLSQIHSAEQKRNQANRNKSKAVSASYPFSAQSFMVLFCVTVSLLILPLMLPPLPPPPLMLLLIPIGILLVLLILGFMPSDVRNIASSYLWE
ncbi:ARGOS-like protein isoform X1 [Dendrobium catenatum]|uniref:ARGOS-like protein n=1 Tax=Dendrobium catenatum TaxID=906689 RepID=A0A2I0WXD0_9ASPA|nr:ARGOS-like protein isoform X1 [Dendrobium catenatum]PKU80319.1 hypothetical protein MA16_Dca005850 [Dendrobium catenatum]